MTITRRLAAGLLSTLALSLSAHAADAQHPVVKLDTTAGLITLELDASKAPNTVANFVQYVKDKHYDGTVFHRVIPRFMIQGGGFTPDMVQKPTRDPIKIESKNGLSNEVGTVAMARTMDPHSATSQFFINVNNNGFLNQAQSRDGYGYTVFGKVTAGMDVVNAIVGVPTTNVGGHQNVPATPIIIRKATLE